MNINKHLDFFDPAKNTDTIHIIGVGATGSNLAHSLVRLGFDDIVLYDFDRLTDHNITNQYYKQSQLGHFKTEALKENLLEINPDANITIEPKGYTDQNLYGIVFLCLDKIEERKRITELNKLNFNIKFLVDIRIGLEEGQMYAIKPNLKSYKKLLTTMQFKDDETAVPRNACGTALTILPTIQIIVSLTVTNLIKYIKGIEVDFFRVTDSIEGISKSYQF